MLNNLKFSSVIALLKTKTALYYLASLMVVPLGGKWY